jgi:O-antigen/teichoic acid export membrane protein
MKLPSLRRAATWSAVENAGLAILSFATLILFARYLSPAEFGLFSVVLAIVELGTVAATMLFHDALIQRDEVDDAHHDSAFWVGLGIGIVFVIACALLAPVFSRVMESAQAGPVLVVSALAVPSAALAAVTTARLRRELNLKPLAVRSLIGRTVAAVAGVLLVVFGAGIWGLVAQVVLIPLAGSLLLWTAVRPRHRLRIDRARLVELLRFGLPSLASLLATYSIRRVFVILAGGLLGSVAAGFLNIAFRLVEVLWSLFSVAIGQVALPVLSRQQHDADAVRGTFRRAGELGSLGVYLCFGLLGALAPEVITILFGERWLPAAPLVTAMSLIVALQLPRLLISAQLSASGRPMLNAAAGAVELAVVVVSLLAVRPSALPLVVALWIGREVVGTALVSVLLHRQGMVRLGAQWIATLPALVGMIAVLGGIWALRQAGLVPEAGPAWLRVVPLGLAGVLLFGLTVLIVDRGIPGRIRRLLRPGVADRPQGS